MDENRKKARAVAKSTTAASFQLERGNDMILNPGVHKPFNDDGVTYCGWWGGDGIHGGCGHVWPCPHWLQGETGEDVTG